MSDNQQQDMAARIATRYGAALATTDVLPANDTLAQMLSRGSCRSFLEMPVPDDVLDVLCAAALAAPTKSDLQQRDIILLKSPDVRTQLAQRVVGQDWVAAAPMIAVFCGNNRRQRLLHEWHGVPFANDHLDAFFNAVADAAIALGAFVTAAEAIGLGCCPISAVRNEATAVSQLLQLPPHVFPLAGLAIGYPQNPPTVSKRLPLDVTCHTDHYGEDGLEQAVREYDAARARSQPYATQRYAETFGETAQYGWSDDKVRQYSAQERAGFGAYVRAQGFTLD